MENLTKIRVETDTKYVLNKEYLKNTIELGLSGVETPIFDKLAGKVFARD